jgi:hypothetical protein
MVGITLDRSRTRWACEWSPTSIARDEMKRLSGVVRVRTWLSHAPSPMKNREKLSTESASQRKVTV